MAEGDKDGPTILVRCDMDALPILEANRADYISETDGKMHACGHDGHTAIGLAVAHMLSEQRGSIAGRVKFVFQPAEEIAAGAQAMVDDGALANPTPEVSLGLHLWNDLPLGEVSLTDGPAMAGATASFISGAHILFTRLILAGRVLAARPAAVYQAKSLLVIRKRPRRAGPGTPFFQE